MSKNRKKNLPTISNEAYLQAFNAGRAATRTADRQLFKTVPKGLAYNWLQNYHYNNVVYPIDKIPDMLLRLIEKRNPVVGAGTTLRIQQGNEYSNISHDKDIPGWEIVLKDENATMTSAQEAQKAFLENLLETGHREDYTPFQNSDMPDNIRERINKYMRDRLLIDKICWEIERNMKGEAVALWTWDGATIFPVLPGGFYGSTSQISAGLGFRFNNLSEKIRQAKIDAIPPVEEIAYVQEIVYGMTGGGIAAAFRNTDLIYDIANDLNDIRYYKQGFSVVEKANAAVAAFINAFVYNSNGLAKGAIPKVAIAMGKESGYTVEQMEDLQDEWMANFEGTEGQWNIPLLNGDAKVLSLMQNNREMEYQKYLEFTGALTLSVMGIDPAECGLRFNQAQNVLNENQDAKQQFSKARGLSDHLGGFAFLVNKVLPVSGYKFAKDFKFRFNALGTVDKGFESELDKKAVSTYKTVNQLRKEKGDQPDPYGDIILDPQYIQYRMQKEQLAQQSQEMAGGEGEEGFGGFSEDDINSAVSEAAESFEKAVRLI